MKAKDILDKIDNSRDPIEIAMIRQTNEDGSVLFAPIAHKEDGKYVMIDDLNEQLSIMLNAAEPKSKLLISRVRRVKEGMN